MVRRKLGFWRRFSVALVKPPMLLLTRRTWRGMENIPRDGGVIIVPNHISHADPLVAAHYVYETGRWPQFLGKASVFKVPVMGWLLYRARQIPVERGTVNAARSLDRLVAAIDAGGAVVIYPEGTTTREPDLWPMRGKTGAARLALATGAPVIPVVMWGPEKIFDPRTARLRLRPRTPVTVVAGTPVDLSRWMGATPTKETLAAMTDEIMLHLRDLLASVRGGTPPPLFTSVPRRTDRTDGPADGEAQASAAQSGIGPSLEEPA